MSKVIIVGLGPGSWTGLPLGTYNILQNGGTNLLRTERHPVVDDLREKGIVFVALDHFYEEKDTFENVYQAIADHVFAQAKE